MEIAHGPISPAIPVALGSPRAGDCGTAGRGMAPRLAPAPSRARAASAAWSDSDDDDHKDDGGAAGGGPRCAGHRQRRSRLFGASIFRNSAREDAKRERSAPETSCECEDERPRPTKRRRVAPPPLMRATPVSDEEDAAEPGRPGDRHGSGPLAPSVVREQRAPGLPRLHRASPWWPRSPPGASAARTTSLVEEDVEMQHWGR